MTTCLNCGNDSKIDFQFCPQCGTKAPEQGDGADTLIGKTLNDKYRVVAEIGTGAMGTGYLGEHVGLKKKVALKVLHPDLRLSDEQLQRFQREGIAAGKFNHPNAIQIFDFDKTENRVIYLAMEFVEGSNLRVYLRRKGKLSVPMALRLTRQVLACLAEAHRHGIVHRDLKPDNIMVVPAARGEVRVKVLDFGLSKLVDMSGKESSLLTQAGRILGTPLYMAPEQCAGEEIDARSDLYAVGLMLYEMVAGIRPFPEESTSELLFTRATKEAPSLLGEFPDMEIPAELDELLVRSMQRRRRDRFQTAEEMMAALESVPLDRASWSSAASLQTSRAAVEAARKQREAAAAAAPAAPAAPAGKGPSRLLLGVLTLLLVGGGSAAAWWLATRPGGGTPVFGSRPARVRLIDAEDRTPAEDQYVRLLDLALISFRSGNAMGARSMVNEALKSEVVDAEAYYVQGEIYRALDDADIAIASYEDALREDEDYVDALLGLGWTHLDRGDVEAAMQRLGRAQEVAPESAKVLTALGIAAFRQGEEEAAGGYVTRALNLEPDQPLALLYRGRLQLDGGDPQAAVDSLVAAKRADEGSWRAAAWLGDAYLVLDRLDDAETQWRAALDLNDTPEVRRDLATLMLEGERYDEAERFLTESLRAHTGDARLTVLLGVALHGGGDAAGAIDVLEEGLRAGASDPESRVLLGILLHEDGRLEEAVAQYRRVISDHGDVPRANLGLGLALYEQQVFEEALQCFARVLDYEEDNVAAHFHLGLLRMDHVGDARQAAVHFQRYLDLGGTDRRVQGWLRQLQ
jgi:serine/threonine-protein kinase